MTIGYTTQQAPPPKVKLTGVVVGRAFEELLIWVILFVIVIGVAMLFKKLSYLVNRKRSNCKSDSSG